MRRGFFWNLVIAVMLAILLFPVNVSMAACNHIWVLDSSMSEDATCEYDGRRWYDCSICGDYKTEVIPATGNHVWVLDSGNSTEPTCTMDGQKWYDCKNCYNYRIEVIPATGVHDWTEWRADGSLCEDGKFVRYCNDCYKEEIRERKGDGNHLWSEWKEWDKPDCLNKGKERRTCLNCYEVEYRDVASAPNQHDWSRWYSYSASTALKKGRMSRECYTCHIVQNKDMPKLKAKITLLSKKKNLKMGKTFLLKIKKRTYGDIISRYLSSNKKVATVNKKGKVVARKRGKAKITVKMKSGCKATCIVTVK